jgi:hypothetical protein
MKTFRAPLLAGCVLVSLLMLGMNSDTVRAQKSTTWKLVWQDEFNEKNGSPVNAKKWTHEVGGAGWGNHELEYYTNRIENSYQADGMLVIKAIKESFSGTDRGRARIHFSTPYNQKKFHGNLWKDRGSNKSSAWAGNLAGVLDVGCRHR